MAIKTVGIIGTGSLGGAFIKSFCNAGLDNVGVELYCYNRNIQKAKEATKNFMQVEVCNSLEEIAIKCDLIILTVTKDSLFEVVNELDAHAKNPHCILVSAEARTDLKDIFEHMHNLNYAARIMTNSNVETGASPIVITLDTKDKSGKPKIKDDVLTLFEKLAPVIEIEEELMDTYTVLTGCLSIYLYVAIEALQDACVNSGIPIKNATHALIETWLGTLKRLQKEPQNLTSIKQELYYPGGITIFGACHLEKVGFRSAFIESYEAMLQMLKDTK